jgi:Fe-S-cluster containining protein
MDDVLDRYGKLLGEVDRWFDGCLSRHPDQIVCGRGCSACCRGLFDITLLDALYLKRGFDRLPMPEQQEMREKSVARLAALEADYPEFRRPWTINHMSEEIWNGMMPEDDETPCPLLSDQGVCQVFAHRPMTCRLNGLPLIDVNGEWFCEEFCTLNFTGDDPGGLEDIRFPFRDLFTRELLLFRELTGRILGRQLNELDTIIPAAVFLDPGTLAQVRLP